LKVPTEEQREKIIKCLTKSNPLSEDVDIQDLAKRTPGYVPADLTSLVRKAGMLAVQRIADKARELPASECTDDGREAESPKGTSGPTHMITQQDFQVALSLV